MADEAKFGASRQVRVEVTGGEGGEKEYVLYAFNLPAVKVDAQQRCERNGSATHAHTMLQSKRRCSAIRDQRELGQSEREGTERERKSGIIDVVACASKNTRAWRKKGRSRGHFFSFSFFLSHGSFHTVIGCRVAFLGASRRRRRLLLLRRFPARQRRGSGTRCRHCSGRLFLG